MSKGKPDALGQIVYQQGKFTIIGSQGPVTMKFKAVYEKDPDGFRGFGMTKDEAKADLIKRATA